MPVSILNAGHGGSDSGAVANGLIERDLNLKVATIAKELMEFNGIKVPSIIGGSDLNEVIRQVNKANTEQKVDIAHSIHHNAGGGDGSETIHSVHYGQATVFSKILQGEFDKIGQNRHGSGLLTKLSSDGIHDYYGFIRYTDPPAIISEFAFIDSNDYKIIDTYEEQYAEGEAIAKAHCRFYGITYKSPKNKPTIQSIDNNKGDDNVLEKAVLLYSKDDYFAGGDVALKYNCAIFIRPSDKSCPKDAFSAKQLFVIGGSSVKHPQEVLLSGNNKFDTCAAVNKYLG